MGFGGRRFIGKDALATRLAKRIELQIERLILR